MSGEESAAVLAARFSRLSFANHHDQATKPSGTSGRGRFVYETPLIDSPPAINKGERNAGRRIVLMPARKRRAGRATESAACAALRLRARSPAGIPLTVFTSGTFVPKAQRRARLPKDHAKAAACRTHRLRSQRCTSRASLSAGRHDARAARVRTVSFRPRAPHSLRHQGVPSRTASF
jgi:hypothetical protein